MQLDTSRWTAYGADVTNIESIYAAGQECIARQGVPDVVIANAGVSWGVDTSLREDLDVRQQVLASNTLGWAATFQPFIEPMKLRGPGRLVSIFSVTRVRGLPRMQHL